MTNDDRPDAEGIDDNDPSPDDESVRARFVPDVVRRRLLMKVLLGLVVVVVISGSIGIFVYQGISQSLEDDVETQVEATTTLHENAYDNWFSDRQRELTTVKENTNLAGTNFVFLSLELDEIATESEFFSELHLIDADTGAVLTSSSDAMRNQNRTGISTEFLGQREFVYPGQYESIDGYPALVFGIDASTQNNVDRTLLAEINATNADLSDGEDPTIEQTIEGATTSVVTRSGEQVIGEEVPGELPADLSSGVRIEESENELRGYQRITSQEEFVVVTQTPKNEAFALRNAVLQNFGLTLAATFLILTAVTVVGSRLLSRNLNVLVERAETIGSGDLDVDLSTARIDEIGVLYDEFDTMRRNLRSRMQEVRSSQEELEQYNEHLNVLDRMLRHNLNNQLNVISLHATQIRDENTGETADSARKILDVCDRILTRIDKQRQITKTLSGEVNRESLDTVRLIDSAVQSVRARYPDAEIELDTPPTAPAVTTYAIEAALTEVIENAIMHNDSEPRQVRIHIRQNDRTVSIDVCDNGPGIPEMERNIFEKEQDIDPLNHSQGIGLWLVNWTVKLSDGELQFDETDTGYNRVRINLPRPQ